MHTLQDHLIMQLEIHHSLEQSRSEKEEIIQIRRIINQPQSMFGRYQFEILQRIQTTETKWKSLREP